jgi:pimeloyl-ACP methyl ester carboxylesterase
MAGGKGMKKALWYGVCAIIILVVLTSAYYYLYPEALFKLATGAQRRAADLVRKEVQVDDHKIVYLEGGKGETILLLHGFGGNKDHWTDFAKHMKGYHLVIPDLPGFGESSQVPEDRYDTENQVGRIARFVEALKLGRFHIAGNSMGGALAAAFAAKYPDKVLTVTLLDTAGVPSEKKSELIVELEKGNNPLLAGTDEGYDRLMTMIFANPPKIPAPFRKILAADWIAHREFNAKIWKDWQPEHFSLEPVLPMIQAPVLILWGDRDRLLDVGSVAFLEKNLKNSRTVILKDTGHCPMIERPEETAEVYKKYLKETG